MENFRSKIAALGLKIPAEEDFDEHGQPTDLKVKKDLEFFSTQRLECGRRLPRGFIYGKKKYYDLLKNVGKKDFPLNFPSSPDIKEAKVFFIPFNEEINSIIDDHNVFLNSAMSYSVTNAELSSLSRGQQFERIREVISEAAPLNLPFKRCIIETEFPLGYCLEHDHGIIEIAPMFSAYIEETAPNSYKFCPIITTRELSGAITVGPPAKEDESLPFEAFVRRLFDKDRKLCFAEETLSKPKSLPNGRGGRELNRVSPVIHVFLSKPKESASYQSLNGGTIDWLHSWSVRGHWRKCASLGKDREGAYCIPGFTWVKDHVRGDGPMVEKTRIVYN